MNRVVIVVLFVLIVLLSTSLQASSPTERANGQPDRLEVNCSSADPDVAHRACLMYAHASKQRGWFSEMTLIVWGPSAHLLTTDKSSQAKLKAMADDGVTLQACKACADSYGVGEALGKLGIEVKYMGEPLTEMLQQGWKVLTFSRSALRSPREMRNTPWLR